MALAGFAAIEAAYRALAPLDPAARHRALAWLTSALGGSETLPDKTDASGGAVAATDAARPAAKSAPAKRTPRTATPGTRATAAGTRERHSVTPKRQPASRAARNSSAKKATKMAASTASGE